MKPRNIAGWLVGIVLVLSPLKLMKSTIEFSVLLTMIVIGTIIMIYNTIKLMRDKNSPEKHHRSYVSTERYQYNLNSKSAREQTSTKIEKNSNKSIEEEDHFVYYNLYLKNKKGR